MVLIVVPPFVWSALSAGDLSQRLGDEGTTTAIVKTS